MKRILITIITAAISIVASGQEVQQLFVSESKVAKLQETKGLFVRKDFYGEGMLVPAILTDLRTGERTPYVLVENYITLEKTIQSVIDFDELPAVIEALEYINNSIITAPSEANTEAYIMTRDGVKIGAMITNPKKQIWSFIVSQSKYASHIGTWTIDRLPKTIEDLKNAKSLLEEKMK